MINSLEKNSDASASMEDNVFIGPKSTKAWVVAADMGYGHQRTAYPLANLAPDGKIIKINNYQGIPEKDKRVWRVTQFFYEFASRFRRIPFIGEIIFDFMDAFQKISGYYPERDLSSPTFGLKKIFSLIKKGWGKDLIEKLKKNPIPLIATFFTPAFMAEYFDYNNNIYCVICDADIARSWVTIHPEKSRIKYFAPCNWARDRLKQYGVRPENIFLTGYPLPKENTGTEELEILKEDLGHRLINLDPDNKYRIIYEPLIKGYLKKIPSESNHPLTIMFSIGGAGAQKEIAIEAIKSLEAKIKEKKLKLIISAGTRKELKSYFTDLIKDWNLDGFIQILSGEDINDYFKKFNQALRTTDILWTKPSELSFYSALGIPIIIAPTLGSQEDLNMRWLLHTGAGIEQGNPRYAGQWIFDLLKSGDFAEMAMQGFVEINNKGTYNIEKIISDEKDNHRHR